MKHLEELAKEYAQKNFPIYEGCNNGNDAIRHDVAYHSFCDGFNEAMRILMEIGNIKSLDKRIGGIVMTRGEEINNEATNYGYCVAAGCPERVYLSEGFQAGALWADENPNLSSLWHDGSEKPKEGADILYISKKGKVHKVSKVDDWFYGWIIENSDIKRWAYINDLLPKE